jgi:hypothetical protein
VETAPVQIRHQVPGLNSAAGQCLTRPFFPGTRILHRRHCLPGSFPLGAVSSAQPPMVNEDPAQRAVAPARLQTGIRAPILGGK